MNIMKKSLLIILFVGLLLIVLGGNVKAADFSASAGKTTMTTGESTTLTLNVTDAIGQFSITSSDTSVVSIEGTTVPWFSAPRIS